MIRDFFFVMRVLVYSAIVTLLLQVQWRGHTLEQRAMVWVTQSSMGSTLTSTAQAFVHKLTRRVDQTSNDIKLPTEPTKARKLIELKRSPAATTPSAEETSQY